MVDLLLERVPLISAEKACPADLVECVATVLWAAPRAGIEELKVVAQQLALKYGDKWALGVAAGAGADSRVNQKVLARLTVRACARACHAPACFWIEKLSEPYRVSSSLFPPLLFRTSRPPTPSRWPRCSTSPRSLACRWTRRR